MTTTDKKAPATTKRAAASTARKAPAKKAPAKRAPAAKAIPAEKVEEKQAAPAPAPVATQAPAPVEKTADVKGEDASAEKTAYEAKLELLTTQLQEGYNEMFEFSKEQMEKFFKVDGSNSFKAVEDAMAFSKENVDAVVKSSSVAAKGFQDVATLFADMTRSSIEENVAASKKVFECKTPQEVAELQAELMKSGYEKLVENATRISEASTKIAEEATKPLQARVEASVEKFNENAA